MRNDNQQFISEATFFAGHTSLICKDDAGMVGLISRRYAGDEPDEGERWRVKVVHKTPRYFICEPVECLRSDPE